MTVLTRWRAGIAATTAALTLLQAFLAGRYLFGSWGIAVHGVVGNGVFVLSAVLVVAHAVPPRDPRALALASVLAALVTVQIGLGYAGRTSLDAAAWHVPNGLLTFGLAVHLALRPPPVTEVRQGG